MTLAPSRIKPSRNWSPDRVDEGQVARSKANRCRRNLGPPQTYVQLADPGLEELALELERAVSDRSLRIA